MFWLLTTSVRLNGSFLLTSLLKIKNCFFLKNISINLKIFLKNRLSQVLMNFRILLTYFLFSYLNKSFGQLHHESISIQGKTTITKDLIVSQSIGQRSITGNTNIKELNVSQGFIQYLSEQKHKKSLIKTIIYPNPFNQFFNIKIDYPIEKVSIEIFTNNGVLVTRKKLTKKEGIFKFVPPSLSLGQYLVKLKGNNYKYSTQILKK